MIDHFATPHRKYLTWANRTVGLPERMSGNCGCAPVAEIQALTAQLGLLQS
jgi:hypothetical protein